MEVKITSGRYKGCTGHIISKKNGNDKTTYAEEDFDYKVIFSPQLMMNCESVTLTNSLSDAVLILNTIAEYTLLLHEYSLMDNYTNMGMIYKMIDYEWIQIDEDGEEI